MRILLLLVALAFFSVAGAMETIGVPEMKGKALELSVKHLESAYILYAVPRCGTKQDFSVVVWRRSDDLFLVVDRSQGPGDLEQPFVNHFGPGSWGSGTKKILVVDENVCRK